MAYIQVPEGRKVRIRKGGNPIPSNGVPLILDEDLTVSLSSDFSAPGENSALEMLTDIGSVIDFLTKGKVSFSGQSKWLTFQRWTKTNPVQLSLSLSFYMGMNDEYNAKTEVYDPVMELINLTLPREETASGERGMTLIPPGMTIGNLLEDRTSESGSFERTSLEIGNILRIGYIIVKKVEPTWSKEVTDTGYPISAKVSIEINSLTAATVEMLSGKNFNAALRDAQIDRERGATS